MAELTVDLTYGSALYEAASELGMKEELLDEGMQIADLLNKESDFDVFLKDPAISPEDKKAVLKNVFTGKISNEMLNFLYVIVDKRRVGRFKYMIKEYKKLSDRDDGVAYGTIVSVEPLKEAHLKRFEEETSKLLKLNVRLENETDRSLIGGVRILVNGRIIDTSLRKRLDDMADSFNL